MSEVRLLIADSDAAIRQSIKIQAVADGFLSDEAADGISTLKFFRRQEYDIVILDGMLSELDSWNVCRQIRKASNVPILILSAKAAEADKLLFFSAGVDDYLIKPISVKELFARINVFLHRTQNNKHNRRIVFDGLCIDTISRVVYVDGNTVSLTPREYSLLLFLAGNPHKAFSREAILHEVWGEDYLGTDRTVDTHVKSLREGIKPYQDYIATVWSYGYIFKG